MDSIGVTGPVVKDDCPPIVRYPKRPSEEMGDFLGRYCWDWWVTITFRDEVGSYTAWNRAREFLRRLERDGRDRGRARRRVGAFVAMEMHQFSRSGTDILSPHLHMLVANVSDLRRDEAWAASFDRNGRTRIEPYDPKLRAAWYIAKYVAKETFSKGDWDIYNNRALRLDAEAEGCYNRAAQNGDSSSTRD